MEFKYDDLSVANAASSELANFQDGHPSFDIWHPKWAPDYLASNEDSMAHQPLYEFVGTNEAGESVRVTLCHVAQIQKLRIVVSILDHLGIELDRSLCLAQLNDHDITQASRRMLHVIKGVHQIGMSEDGCLGGIPVSRPRMKVRERENEAALDVGHPTPVNGVALGVPDLQRSVVDDGFYVGKVLGIAGDVVTQKVNRDGATVRHLASRLSASVEIDAVVTIKYSGDVGEVTCARTRVVER